VGGDCIQMAHEQSQFSMLFAPNFRSKIVVASKEKGGRKGQGQGRHIRCRQEFDETLTSFYLIALLLESSQLAEREFECFKRAVGRGL